MGITGIDAISYYIPKQYLSIYDLAVNRDIDFGKLSKGLGLVSMAVCDIDEDVVTMSAEAVLRLIEENGIDPREIGRLYLGTESALDSAKPTATYVQHIVEEKLEYHYGKRCLKNCDVIDMTFACVGAVDALHNSLDWVKAGTERKAIVIAADNAKYDLGSTGEYTQGAGAVAMLVSENPRLASISDTWGVATESVNDFFKPRRTYSKKEIIRQASALLDTAAPSDAELEKKLKTVTDGFWGNPDPRIEVYREEPIYDGPFSNQCYTARITEAIAHFRGQRPVNILEEWDFIVFHLPYAYQARRMVVPMWIEWMKEQGQMGVVESEADLHYNPADKEHFKMFVKAVSQSPTFKKFIADRIEREERASSRIGNMYTASLFMGLISTLRCLYEENVDATGKKIGCLSYGSGSKSKIFEMTVGDRWKEVVAKLNIFGDLDARTPVDFETYVKLHTGSLEHPVNRRDIRLKSVGTEGTNLGYHRY